MRGKVTNNAVCWQLFRITPAYAGKSGGNVMSQMAYTDHPRLCGEKLESDAILGENAGSPPPMRGKVLFDTDAAYGVRITPAYAGKSSTIITSFLLHQDHPRLCGEKISSLSSNCSAAGSPPPMRGKENQQTNIFLGHRITPAYAGKRIAYLFTLDDVWDHPRLCGEKFLPPKVRWELAGSPPPMRGKDLL